MVAVPRSLYPFEPRARAVNGLRMSYLDEGAGEPLVMLHGNPTWSFYFRGLVAALRGTRRVIAPDHIGCGLSEKPDESRYPYTLARRVDDLEALLEAVAPRGPLSLVLHDWGGMIGMAWAHRHPERVARLVLMNTAAFHLPHEKPFPWQLKLARSPAGAVAVRGLNLFCRGAARYCVARRPLPAEVRAAYLAPYDSWANRVAVHRFVTDIPLTPRDPGYELVSAVDEGLARFADRPALIVWGLRDFVFDWRFLDGWRRRLPRAQVHAFPDCGHYLLEDAGAEIPGLVESFLSAHPLARAA